MAGRSYGRPSSHVARLITGRWLLMIGLAAGSCGAASAQNAATASRNLPELTQPVNDFARIIDPESAQQIDRISRSLRAASGDVIAVATVPTVEPYADINEYAVKLFENHGRGIGDKGKDNGVLIVAALKERKVRVEVGYDLEQWITDGFAGETIREFITPSFRQGRYGAGLVAGTDPPQTADGDFQSGPSSCCSSSSGFSADRAAARGRATGAAARGAAGRAVWARSGADGARAEAASAAALAAAGAEAEAPVAAGETTRHG